MKDLYCSMIHGGLRFLVQDTGVASGHCCMRKSEFNVDIDTDYWKDHNFVPLREKNKQNVWSPGCENCQSLEAAGQTSFRQGMNQGLGIDGTTDLSGPTRIDLVADINCNLACRTCGPEASTFWQKHLKSNGEWSKPVQSLQYYDTVIKTLSKLDLSNLRMLVFSGGETLLGQAYWDIVVWLADHVPNAKQQLTLCFQTNGTQPIHPRYYELIDRFQLVKLHISLDGVDSRFEYLRWPAQWSQTVDNIFHLKETAPSNVMFLIEETVSVYNLWYTHELEQWVQQNFTINREGDIVNHTKHLAKGIFSLASCSKEYVSAMQSKINQNLIPVNWQEDPSKIQVMINTIKKFDQFRSQSFEKTFPEVSEFYSRFL